MPTKSAAPERRRARAAKKTTIALPEDALETLRQLATERNTSFAEVIRRAITVERYLSEATRGGARLLLEEPGESRVKELVLF